MIQVPKSYEGPMTMTFDHENKLAYLIWLVNTLSLRDQGQVVKLYPAPNIKEQKFFTGPGTFDLENE